MLGSVGRVCVLGVVALAAGSGGGEVTAADRPNILFIFTDDHASHAIGAYGSRINQTPHIDRLAREGMLFQNAFCTNSICAPSRAVILTGKHSHLNGQMSNLETFDGTQQTFPKLLRGAGYETALIGKWHLKSQPTGFDHWEVLIGQGPYYNPSIRSLDDSGQEVHLPREGYTTDILTDMALGWLSEERDPSKPFLLMYQHKAPHRRWEPGPRHLSTFDSVTIPEPDNLFDDFASRAPGADLATMSISRYLTSLDLKLEPPANLTPEQLELWNAHYEPKNRRFREANLEGADLVRWKYQRYIKDYLRAVASVDDNLGRVLDYLQSSGLSRNTVVIYSSDQGFYLGDHGWFDKRWMYEESLRMPLIVRWPGVVEPGTVNDDLVQNLDFAQTFLEMAGVAQPEAMQGRSLVPLLRGNRPRDWRRSIYYHYYELPGAHDVPRHYGVRDNRYKLIHYYDMDAWELFDLQSDPREMVNLYAHPGSRSVQRRLSGELKRLRKQYRVEDGPDLDIPGRPHKVKSELVVAYDGRKDTSGGYRDRSGNAFHAVGLGDVSVGTGRRARSFRFAGEQALECGERCGSALNPSYRPLTVGAWYRPLRGDGVLLSQGNARHGMSLYLRDWKPAFVVRSWSQAFKIQSDRALKANEWVHLRASVGPDRSTRLLLNGEVIASRPDGELLRMKPGEVLTLGADPGGRVDDEGFDHFFHGEMEDFRLYWGVVPKRTLRSWMR